MRKINPTCCNGESFMYSIIISLQYYDISHNSEKISTLRPCINNYDFTDIISKNPEVHNPDISLLLMMIKMFCTIRII